MIKLERDGKNTTDKSYNTINGRQRYVTKSGRKWESQVKDFVNERLQSSGLELTVIRGDEIPKDSKLCPQSFHLRGGTGTPPWDFLELKILAVRPRPRENTYG